MLRWVLGLAVCAVVVAVAGLWLRAPDTGERSAGLPRQVTALVAPARATVASAPVRAASVPHRAVSVASALSADRLLNEHGSEGYAPRLRRAAESSDPEAWVWAVRTLSACREPERLEEAAREVHQMGTMGQAPGRLLVALGERRTRWCQTVTPELLALQQPLARRLLGTGDPRALTLLELSMSLAERVAARDELGTLRVARAQRNDPESLFKLASFGLTYGIGPAEQRAYLRVFQHCHPRGWEQGPGDFQTGFIPEEHPSYLAALRRMGKTPAGVDPALVLRAEQLAAVWIPKICGPSSLSR